MTTLWLITALVALAAALLLELRLRAPVEPHPLQPVQDFVTAEGPDATLHHDVSSWQALPIAHREVHDPYADVRECLAWLARADLRSVDATEKFVKAVCQLHDTLAPQSSANDLIEACFRIRPPTDAEGRRLDAGFIRPGERVDSSRMWPLTAGDRVRVALGVTLRDPDGVVLSRAKVVAG